MNNSTDKKNKVESKARDNSSFVYSQQNASAKTKSNLIDIPSITLPKGGGAMKGIDEKFSVNAANGTASFSIPLPFSPGRNGNTPSLSMNYNSGSGKGIFGIGWNLDCPTIQRRTDKKLPEYKDAEDSDIFVFSGTEDLIPELTQEVNGNWIKVSNNGITRYRPRIEGNFVRIEKINENGNIYWRTRTKDNIVSVFGKSDDAKLFDPNPDQEYRIFKWCIEYSYDDKGNFTQYYYKKENKDGINPSLSEKNRLNSVSLFANIYLKGVKYGNDIPFHEGDDLPVNFLFELVFDFGEHDKTNPSTKEANKWPKRSDAFSNFKAGFDVRTYRICRRILMFHHFKEDLKADDYLVRSLDFVYDEQPNISFLKSITQTGYILNTDNTLKSLSVPPLEFSYTPTDVSREVKEISPDNIANAPVGIDSPYQWIDLYSEGISGILTEQANGWFYKENLGNGSFSPAKLVRPRPSFSGLNSGTLAIQDLEANGSKCLVKLDGPLKGYFGLNQDDEWESFYAFTTFPNIDIKDPNLKFIDLDGDGMPDILLSKAQDFIWYRANGISGYDDYHLAVRAEDEEKGPQILFADTDEKMMIATADMCGGGMQDIVVITYAEVYYYPNLGFGNFGAKVTMEMNGCFDSFSSFNPQNIYLTDIDGSGTTDIVYTGNNKFQAWFNQSGNSLSDPSEFFNPFPDLINRSKLAFVDLLGNGTSCIVWSSSLPEHSNAPLRYIDMMNGIKPHVLCFYKNNLGKEVTLKYKSSTQYYLDDKKMGKKWVTKLPFPVQCLSKVCVHDKVSETRFANEYSYHHGYYDAVEREYRGFAMVEQRDTEEYDTYVAQTQASGSVNTTEKDLYQPAVITKTWYHTGAYLNKERMFNLLQQEYYPSALISSGQITDPTILAALINNILPENDPPDELSGEEYFEFCRSLKGLPLRQEVYSDEGSADIQLHPYTVTQYNYDVQLLQPASGQLYSVFFSHGKETLTFNFERNPLDPRITHTIHTSIDSFGNILESASIVYGRKNADPQLPTAADKAKQTAQLITYIQNKYTTLIDTDTAYRLPVICEAQTWELNIPPPAKNYFKSNEISNAFANATIKLYEQDTSVNEKRKIEHVRTLFQRNDLTGPMPFGTVDTLGLPYENYLLAFTQTLLQTIYGGKYDENLVRNKALYVRSEGDNNYWIKSGKIYFYPDLTAAPNATTIPVATMNDVNFAKSNFYLPVTYEDNFGNLTKVFYDKYKLFIMRRIDAVRNEMNVDEFNYRIPSPYITRDANNNRTAVRFDELGRVIRTFVMGKDGELKGDPIDTTSTELSNRDQPTSIIEYQFRYFQNNLPDRVKLRLRETHYFIDPQPSDSPGGIMGWLTNLFGGNSDTRDIPATNPDPVWQESYSYSDGSGHEVLKKLQAEPGLAPQRDANGKLVLDSFGRIVMIDSRPDKRWVGNGKTIYNNKGNPVKQYEPYFDSSFEFNDEEELVMLGYSSTIYYDALTRVIKTKHANGTFSKVEFDNWMQITYDENDTVMDSDWYAARINGSMGPDEQQAAQQTSVHYNTPTIAYFDSLARTFLKVDHNKTQRSNEAVLEEFYYTRIELDIEGNEKNITDTRGNPLMIWKHDMLGNICYQNSMDAGERWLLADVMGKPLRLWDSRKQIFSYVYDSIHRPQQLLVNTGSGDIVYEEYHYGEEVSGGTTDNLRGKLYKHFDTAGLVITDAYDFKGNAITSLRQLLIDYKNIPNWSSNPTLDTESFDNEISFDALNRPVQMITPDGSIFLPKYNEANLLNSIDVKLGGGNTSTNFISNIDYNAKAQRDQIFYGNNTVTKYTYDLQTFRLTRLLTTANNGVAILQDLNYTYDPVGNITQQFDNAQKTVFYGGQQVEAQSNYIYDAIYRLIEGAGREHVGQVAFNGQDNWNDNWCNLQLQPNSPVQLRNYSQKYFYDGVGNIMKMQHIAGSTASWTRTYQYNAGNNQLNQTAVSGQNYKYTYNEHGSMITMPNLQQIDWNMLEEMQHANLGGGGDAYFVYDSGGQRVRKVIDKGGGKITERIYIGTYEVYRERIGTTVTLEHEILHVMDDKQRVAMVDTRTNGNDGTVSPLSRYQYSNHLGGACLELDDAAKIISYEEYHPYGTSAYRATDNSRQVPAKRYRYTGMERDEETGLNYHSARYYVNWLGRWISTDPIGISGGNNLYVYSTCNPIIKKDLTGHDPDDDEAPKPPQPPIYNPGPTQTAGVPIAVPEQPTDTPGPKIKANTEINYFLIFQSPSDKDVGWTTQTSLQLHVRLRTGEHTEQGILASYGGVIPLGGRAIIDKHPDSSYQTGGVQYTLHIGDTVDPDNKSFQVKHGNWFNAGVLFGNPGKGDNFNPTATYIRALSLISGSSNRTVDLNVGATAQLWGQVNNKGVLAYLSPYVAANVSKTFKNDYQLNFEVLVGTNLGLAGTRDSSLGDPAVPASLRLTGGIGVQKQFGPKQDYTWGLEVLGTAEPVANVPNAPGVSLPWTIGVAATISAF